MSRLNKDEEFIKDLNKMNLEKKLLLDSLIFAVDAPAKRLQKGDEKQEAEVVYRIKTLENWEALKADIVKAVNTGYQNGYHIEERTEPKGRFEAYRYVIDKMEALEKYEE